MNTTFNINRLGLLLKRYFTENKQRELTFWGITLTVFIVMHQPVSVIMYIIIAGMFTASYTFKIFGSTPGGMHYLLIPATHIEKLVAVMLVSTVYYFAMFMVMYSIGTVIGINAGNMIFGTNQPVVLDLFQSNTSNVMHLMPASNHTNFMRLLTSFVGVQATFMVGSLYFKRNAVGKTLLCIIAIGFLLGIIEILFLKSLTNPQPINGVYAFNAHLENFSESFSPLFKTISSIVGYLMIPFLWTVSYFRLTEKEV